MRGKTKLHAYATRWIDERELGDRTRDKYKTNEGRGETTVAAAYRFLRAVMSTALGDERIRWGELVGLRRADVDLRKRVIHVRRTLMQLDTGHLKEGPPKSAAGARAVSMPPILVDELKAHLAVYTRPGPRARVFTGSDGGDLRRDNWHRDADWTTSLKAAGLPKGFHFHDLRHTGNHLASQSGATLKELMRRMGHGSVRAAMIYQHATGERDREIADLLGGLVDKQAPG